MIAYLPVVRSMVFQKNGFSNVTTRRVTVRLSLFFRRFHGHERIWYFFTCCAKFWSCRANHAISFSSRNWYDNNHHTGNACSSPLPRAVDTYTISHIRHIFLLEFCFPLNALQVDDEWDAFLVIIIFKFEPLVLVRQSDGAIVHFPALRATATFRSYWSSSKHLKKKKTKIIIIY